MSVRQCLKTDHKCCATVEDGVNRAHHGCTLSFSAIVIQNQPASPGPYCKGEKGPAARELVSMLGAKFLTRCNPTETPSITRKSTRQLWPLQLPCILINQWADDGMPKI